jgi:hypothetical protein
MNNEQEKMCYSYALGYNAGYNIGYRNDILELIDKQYLHFFNDGYDRGIADYCAEQE